FQSKHKLTTVLSGFLGASADCLHFLNVLTAAGKHGGTLEISFETAKFTANPRVLETCGEILPDGTVVDLVAADQERLDLLIWDGDEKPIIVPAINRGSILYHPPVLHPSVREAVTFPIDAVEYGTTTQLFTKIFKLYGECLGLPKDLGAFATCWTLGSWIPELLPVPLTLCVIGARLPQIQNLFRAFRSLCRRALPVAELSRRLPFFLRPTLLVNDPKLSGKAL